MFESARKKNQEFHRAIVSEQKQKYFESVRKRMLDAHRHQELIQEREAQLELMKMFQTREEYEHTMKLYEEYERDMEEYMQYMEELQEESNNFHKIQMEAELRRKNEIFQEMFNDQ